MEDGVALADMPNALPKISIVTPSYNQGDYVAWTVRSVLLQRYPNLEYVFMDGGSNDSTLAAVAPYRDRFAHFESAKDKGQADAVARGFGHCTGEIMAYLNSDDMLAPGALMTVAQYFQDNPQVDAVYSHRVTVGAANKAVNYWILPHHSSYLMKRWDLIPQETCFWRRRLFEKCGNVDPAFRFALDYDLFVRYMNAGKFARLNCFLGAFRFHENAKTSRMIAEVGYAEIKKVQAKNQLLPGSQLGLWGFDKLGSAFSLYVQRAAARHIALRHNLPGGLPGLGYDYDEVWGGQLCDSRLPPLVTARA